MKFIVYSTGVRTFFICKSVHKFFQMNQQQRLIGFDFVRADARPVLGFIFYTAVIRTNGP